MENQCMPDLQELGDAIRLSNDLDKSISRYIEDCFRYRLKHDTRGLDYARAQAVRCREVQQDLHTLQPLYHFWENL